MTSIRDAVLARQPKRQTECRVCQFLRTQSEQEVAEWEDLLAQPNQVFTAKSLADEMTVRWHETNPEEDSMHYVSVTQHRNGHA